MNRRGKSIHLAIALTAALFLTGCEGMGNSVANIKSSFGDLVTAGNSLFKTEGQTQPAVNKVTDNTEPMPAAPTTDIVAPESILVADEQCPKVSVVNELGSIHRFANMNSPVESGNISNIKITDIISGCRYTEDSIVMETNIKFEGTAGQQARLRETDTPSFSYPYFVAVTSPQGNILAKNVYSVTMSYDVGKKHNHHEAQVRQIVPLGNGIYGPDHALLVGFQLSPQELAYNRGQIAPSTALDKAFALATDSSVADDMNKIVPAAGSNTPASQAPLDITGR